MPRSTIDEFSARTLFVLSIAVFLLLVLRDSGLYPTVFADEYTYSKFARLMPLNESAIPSYLYLSLYSLTNYCGDGFLGCARVLNALFFVAAMPFIFMISRAVASNTISIAVSLLAVIGPINSYTAYFMPEGIYFLSFWILAWYLLKLDAASSTRQWLVAGAIYGLSALIKPHSIFFLPALIAYVFYLYYKQRVLFTRQAFINTVALVIGTSLVKFLFGYLVAGESGITIFGPLYGSIASSTTYSPDRYLELFILAFESLKGHVMVLALLYGLPLALACAITLRQLAPSTTSAHLDKISVFSILVIFNLIFVVALFTASVANSGPYESTARLHMRYYNFALPLFYIVVGGLFAANNTGFGKPIRFLLGALISVIALYALSTKMAPFVASHVDNPELRGLYVNKSAFKIVGGLSVLALFTWAVRGRAGIRLYFLIALPLFVLISAFYVTVEQRNRLQKDAYDKAGIFTRQYLSDEDISKVLIVGSESAGLFRSLFYLDNPNAALETIPRGSTYDTSRLPADKEWILLIGDHSLSDNTFFQLHMNGFTLARVAGSNTIDFKKSNWPGVLLKTRGLSSTESWGTWSASGVVTFEFTTPLPDKFKLHLIAHAFGPNIGKEFVAYIGNNATRFTLSATDEQKVLELNNPERSNILSVHIPSPVSPKELGLSGDQRSLGIGFVEMKIEH